MAEAKNVHVAAAIIIEGGKLYATQRGYGGYKGYWEFPGGKIEPGETPEQAVVREIHEELATTVQVDGQLCHVEYDYPEFHLSMECLLCTVVEGELELLEHTAAKWLEESELFSLQWLGADIEVLETIQAQGLLK